jgi:hypothetical protein
MKLKAFEGKGEAVCACSCCLHDNPESTTVGIRCKRQEPQVQKVLLPVNGFEPANMQLSGNTNLERIPSSLLPSFMKFLTFAFWNMDCACKLEKAFRSCIVPNSLRMLAYLNLDEGHCRFRESREGFPHVGGPLLLRVVG